MVILIIGSPGSGKDTQARFIADNYGYIVVSTGDIFREEIASGSDLGRKLHEYVDKGTLVPDEMVYQILENYLNRPTFKDQNIVLTGVVRTPEQIPLLDKALSNLDRKLDKVVFFKLNDEEAVERLSARWFCPKDDSIYNLLFNPPKVLGKCDICGGDLAQREDDKPEAVRVRFPIFHKSNDAITKAYSDRGILIEIDAGATIAEVSSEVASKVF